MKKNLVPDFQEHFNSEDKRPTFQSPYEEGEKYVGQPFTILGLTPDTDEEVGPLYRIRFESGEEWDAWPEEVYTGTGWEPLDLEEGDL